MAVYIFTISLVAKLNEGFWRIHPLLFLHSSSVSNYIFKKVENLKYATLENIHTYIHRTSQGVVIIKKDIQHIFQNILVISYQ